MKAVLFLFLFCAQAFWLFAQKEKRFTYVYGAIVRGDSTKKELALVFTGDEFAEGLPVILQTLKKQKVKAGFFFTGRFYRNPTFKKDIQELKRADHYLGPHSNAHLLYCDWNKRDSLLVTKDSFEKDIRVNLAAMNDRKISVQSPQLFIPPFEWWNDSITSWSSAIGLKLFNFTPGIRTNADYTWPGLGTTYKSSDWIMNWLKDFVAKNPSRLNGAVVLIHAGTDPRRKDKFYNRLNELILFLKEQGYVFKRIDELIK